MVKGHRYFENRRNGTTWGNSRF